MAAPAAKKARVEEPKPFQQLDVDAMTMKVVDGKDDKDDKYYVALLNNEVIEFLLTPAEPTKITWGFDMDGSVEQRSFNCAGVKGKGNENLSIRVELGDEQAEFLQKVDEKMQSLFGEKLEWTPMVARNELFNKGTARLQVCLKGNEAALTLLKFKPGDVVEKGSGWEFLNLRETGEQPPKRLHRRRGQGGGEAASLQNDRQERQGQGRHLDGRHAALHQA